MGFNSAFKGLRKNFLNRCTRQSPAESDDTRGCIHIQLRSRPPEDEQSNSRNIQRISINMLYVNKREFCASSWRSNKVILRCTVNRSSRKTSSILLWEPEISQTEREDSHFHALLEPAHAAGHESLHNFFGIWKTGGSKDTFADTPAPAPAPAPLSRYNEMYTIASNCKHMLVTSKLLIFLKINNWQTINP